MMLEMIANANWERPIYVATTVGQENYMNLGDNFVQEGLANRITPFTTNVNGKPVAGMKQFDTQKTYENVMNHFKFGGLSKPGLYLDETVMRMCFTHRRLLSQLAIRLVQESSFTKAAQILQLADKEIPDYNVPHDFQGGSFDLVRSYLAMGANAEAKKIIEQLWTKSAQYVKFYTSLSPMKMNTTSRECMLHLYLLETLHDFAKQCDPALAERYAEEYEQLARAYQMKGGSI
jgi:hypothetical protein